jgi:threonine dehydrogenase-like Zn-dependent dehydrogenase
MDLELVRGYYPFTGVPGHEFVREVVEIMESDDSSRREPRNLEISESAKWIGKRVVGEINVSCGECEQCKNDRFTYCENRMVLGIVNLGALRQVDDEDRPLAEF